MMYFFLRRSSLFRAAWLACSPVYEYGAHELSISHKTAIVLTGRNIPRKKATQVKFGEQEKFSHFFFLPKAHRMHFYLFISSETEKEGRRAVRGTP